MRLRTAIVAGLAPLAALALAPAAMASSTSSATKVAQRVKFHRPVVSIGANKSSNWSGYNQGSLERGGTQFHQISGTWRVPTATPHKAGEAEYSSNWIGIGGGCVDAGCSVTDSTLIQTGTEQDTDSSGHATYSAWWELIPAPSVQIANFTVNPGDVINASITESPSGSNVWTFSLKDVTRNESFSMTTPYSSSHLTAEWIEETPVSVGNNGNVSVGPLPTLSRANFDSSATNGVSAGLKPSEALQLSSPSTGQLATPSAPDSDTDGFNDCAYAGSCAVPAS
jgi:hypothetical protein